jgi:hypothetical protein
MSAPKVIKVSLHDQPRRFGMVEQGATIGAQIGTNLFDENGNLFSLQNAVLQLLAQVPTASSSTAWGSITGDITAQADLQSQFTATLVAANTYADGKVIDSIADADTTHAPSRNAVYDALAALSTVYQPLDSDLTAIAALTTTAYGRAFLTLADAAAGRTALSLGTASLLASDTDTSLSANSDSRAATQKATKAYVDALIAASDAVVYKGATDCSGNPNYPAADAGHLYVASVAGRIGGAAGTKVEVGDFFICRVDGSAAGTQAAVGANWNVIQTNLVGAVIGPASATDGHVAFFDGATGQLIKDSGLTLAGTNTGDETAASVATILHAATGKTTPVDADELPIIDSAASNALKKLTFANLKVWVKAYADTLYGAVATINTWALAQTFSAASIWAAVSTPSAPAAGFMAPYAKALCGREMPFVLGPSGIERCVEIPEITGWHGWYKGFGSAAGTSVGIAQTNTVTPVQTSPTSTNRATLMHRSTYSSVVTTPSQQIGSRATFNTLFRGNAAGIGGFWIVSRFVFTTIKTAERFFCGVSATTNNVTVDPSSLTNIAGFGFDTADSAITFMHNDGSGTATKTAIAGQATLATNNTGYIAVIGCYPNDSKIYYALYDLVQGVWLCDASVNTDLPVNTTALGFNLVMSNGTANTAANDAQLGISTIDVYTES